MINRCTIAGRENIFHTSFTCFIDFYSSLDTFLHVIEDLSVGFNTHRYQNHIDFHVSRIRHNLYLLIRYEFPNLCLQKNLHAISFKGVHNHLVDLRFGISKQMIHHLDQKDFQTMCSESFTHFNTNISSTNYSHTFWPLLFYESSYSHGIFRSSNSEDPLIFDSLKIRHDGGCPGSHHQFLVFKFLYIPILHTSCFNNFPFKIDFENLMLW